MGPVGSPTIGALVFLKELSEDRARIIEKSSTSVRFDGVFEPRVYDLVRNCQKNAYQISTQQLQKHFISLPPLWTKLCPLLQHRQAIISLHYDKEQISGDSYQTMAFLLQVWVIDLWKEALCFGNCARFIWLRASPFLRSPQISSTPSRRGSLIMPPHSQ